MVTKFILRDQYKRQVLYKRELLIRCLRVMYHCVLLPLELRKVVFQALCHTTVQGKQTQIRNRCLLTGRSRGVYRFFRLSRFCIRSGVVRQVLPYVRKSSW